MTAFDVSGAKLSIRGLPDRDLKAVEREARLKPIKAGEILVHQDDPVDAMHILLEGVVSRAKVLPDGRRQTIGLMIAGDCCDLFECLSRRSDSIYASVTDGTVAVCARETVLDWIESRPAIARVLWQSARSREAIVSEWLVNLGHRNATERMAHLFCELIVRFQSVGLGHDDAFDFPLRQHELAEIVGLSTVHVNRTLQTLRTEGLIELRNHHLKIPNVGRLKARAMFDAGYLQWAQSDMAIVPVSPA